jgi:hypothetical protein
VQHERRGTKGATHESCSVGGVVMQKKMLTPKEK